jgi:hypothetical protein
MSPSLPEFGMYLMQLTEQLLCQFLGFHSSAVEVLIFLGYGSVSLGDW